MTRGNGDTKLVGIAPDELRICKCNLGHLAMFLEESGSITEYMPVAPKDN
jgi:hypothetical protein